MYATLALLKQEIEGKGDDFDAYLYRASKFVNHRIDTITNNTYEPYIEEKRYDALGQHIDHGTIELIDIHDAFSITQVSIEGTVITDWEIYPYNKRPIRQLRRTANKTWNEWSTSYVQSIRVTGIWGYSKTAYTSSWQIADTLAAQISSTTATTIQVSDINGADWNNVIPRFSKGSFIRVESEFMEVTDIDAGTQMLTVHRGVNGSTAATHANSTPVYSFYADDNIIRAAVRWVAYLHSRRGHFETLSIDGGATIEFPADQPQEVDNILNRVARRRWMAV